jgi:cytochrome c oxidase subunit 2
MVSVRKIIIVVCTMAIALVACFPGTAALADSGKVIKITAKKYEYNPNKITLKKGVPVTLEFTSLDRLHGFNCPDLGIRADILPGKVSRVQFVPKKSGTFPFHCDNFCGEGHENMTGEFVVTE